MGALLARLAACAGDFELIIVDGASTDATRSIVREAAAAYPRPLSLIRTVCDRSAQLNRGASAARGEALLFLHADVLPPPDAIVLIERALGDRAVIGGDFLLTFDGDSAWSAAFTWIHRVRRRFGVYYGDSGLFVRREVFVRLGGFRALPIMDDYEFIRRLECAGRTICLPATVHVSDRRWRLHGAWRTMWWWFWIQFLYSAGVSPRHLAGWYKPVRE